ncbi:MAG: hypothetical protein QOD86_2515 [Miltoncostaeaceae bacterium]|nr:hypothetical protein [Miltoncostaeaceae bacterium]
MKAFLAYAYGAAAQGALGALNYAPLPAAVASAAAAKAATLS